MKSFKFIATSICIIFLVSSCINTKKNRSERLSRKTSSTDGRVLMIEGNSIRADTAVNIPVLGEWNFKISDQTSKESLVLIKDISFKCIGQTTFQSISLPEPGFPISTLGEWEYPIILDPISWGEIKQAERAITYRLHRGHLKDQNIKSVVFLRFLPWTFEVQLEADEENIVQGLEDERQLVLDLQKCCTDDREENRRLEKLLPHQRCRL